MQCVFDFYRELPVRPRRPERLFFALLPDSEAASRVSEFGEQFVCKHGLEGVRFKAERLHVSLHHLGDFKRLRTALVYAARQAGKAVSLAPSEITFRFIKSFEGAPSGGGLRRRPLVLLGEAGTLSELHNALAAAMEENGLRAAGRFNPHMTLFYGPKPIPMQPIEPIHLTFEEFALVHSKLSLSQYEVIERWPLTG